MKKIILFIIPFISGCYLANGSPSESKYWLRNGKTISIEDNKKCSENIYPNLGGRYNYLYEKRKQVGFVEFYKNREEFKEYEIYLRMADKLLNQCFYDLGYRFKAPLYWCLAQDGDNTRICMENMKYRN